MSPIKQPHTSSMLLGGNHTCRHHNVHFFSFGLNVFLPRPWFQGYISDETDVNWGQVVPLGQNLCPHIWPKNVFLRSVVTGSVRLTLESQSLPCPYVAWGNVCVSPHMIVWLTDPQSVCVFRSLHRRHNDSYRLILDVKDTHTLPVTVCLQPVVESDCCCLFRRMKAGLTGSLFLYRTV